MPASFKVSDKVVVTNKLSNYYNLKATVKEVLFKDAGIIEFAKSELEKAARAEQVLRARPTVYFYWRELARAKVSKPSAMPLLPKRRAGAPSRATANRRSS